MPLYETLKVESNGTVASVYINRPDKANALNEQAWNDLRDAMLKLDEDENIRVIILSGNGKHFCSGIDLSMLQSILHSDQSCPARQREKLRKQILDLQSVVATLEKISKPIIASISGACIGAGLDIIAACDLRYSTDDAFFSIKEIDMSMVADLGSLQRLPYLIPDGLVREMAFTGRNLFAREAVHVGLINATYASQEELTDAVKEMALTIASKSPVSIRGTKHILNYGRNHSQDDSLNYMAVWNAAMLVSADIQETFMAKMEKRTPTFKN